MESTDNLGGELVDMVIDGAQPSDIHTAIQDILSVKAADKIDELKPSVANGLFGAPEEQPETESEVETETEISQEPQTEE